MLWKVHFHPRAVVTVSHAKECPADPSLELLQEKRPIQRAQTLFRWQRLKVENEHDFILGDDVVGKAIGKAPAQAERRPPCTGASASTRTRTIGRDDQACELLLAARVNQERRTSELRLHCYAAHLQRQRLGLGEKINVSDLHHPFCTPTKHTLSTRNQQTKTFPKSTYATGDDGIPGESQKEIKTGQTKIGIPRIYGRVTLKKSKKTWR
jgi:hypothetical protein